MRVAINILSASKVYAPVKIGNLDEKRIVPKMMLRRRLTRNAKIMLFLADSCACHSGKVVYASAFGELQATVGITDAILDKNPISPTLFQNSVYNSAPSYFSLLHGDKEEIITLSNGDKSSKDAIQTATLQSLVSGERVFCVATECLDIERINEVNSCTMYLEAGAGLVLEIAQDEQGAVVLEDNCEVGMLRSLHELISLVNMYEDKKTKVYIDL